LGAPATAAHGASATEQAIIALLPYRLGEGQAPDGFIAFAQSATSNVALAFSLPAEQRDAALASLRDGGRIAGLEQQFEPAGAAAPIIRYGVSLYASAEQALTALGAATMPDVAAAPAPFAAPRLGDSVLALSSPGAPDASAGPAVLLAWTRGRLLFAILAAGRVDDAQDTLEAQVVAFAQAADDQASTVAAVLPAAPEARDGDAAAQLALANAFESRQLTGDAAPPAFDFGGSYIWSNEQLVLDAAAPEETAQTITQDWRRLTGEVAYFIATDGSRAVLSSVYEGFGDEAGASLALQTPTLGAGSDDAIVPLLPPVTLGEEMIAYRADVAWPQGETRRAYTLRWRQGRVLLGVSVNLPRGSAMPPYLARLAQQLDAMYSADPVPLDAPAQ
ncbi:MAG TPA: hypothetical protein VFA70_00945, partial [Dehalococcoidia bacterium]|nr:hypothetical protein [Dehalococcoidia bacterium]